MLIIDSKFSGTKHTNDACHWHVNLYCDIKIVLSFKLADKDMAMTLLKINAIILLLSFCFLLLLLLFCFVFGVVVVLFVYVETALVGFLIRSVS